MCELFLSFASCVLLLHNVYLIVIDNFGLLKSLSKSKKSNSNPNKEKKTASSEVEEPLKKSMPRLKENEKLKGKIESKVESKKNKSKLLNISPTQKKTTSKQNSLGSQEKVEEKSKVKKKIETKTNQKKAIINPLELINIEDNSPAESSDIKKKRGRKKKEELSEKLVKPKEKDSISKPEKKDLKTALLKKLKGKKEKSNPVKSLNVDLEDDFPATPEDLEDEIADAFSGIVPGEEPDDVFSLSLDTPIAKRRPGRPPKNKDAISATENIKFPSTMVRIPKKIDTRPKKPLSDTLPGTNLASLFLSEELFNNSSSSRDSKPDAKIIINQFPHEGNEDESEEEVTPSWQPRNWVTSEGERLVIKGNELVKEERFGSLDAESTYGVIAPDQVDDVIRKIREAYKKKTISKKTN